MYINLCQHLKLYGKYTFISTSMNFIIVNELSIMLFAYVLTFNSINGRTIAPFDNQTTSILSILHNEWLLTPIENQLHSMTINGILETYNNAQRRIINCTFRQLFIWYGQSLTWTDKHAFSNNSQLRKKKFQNCSITLCCNVMLCTYPSIFSLFNPLTPRSDQHKTSPYNILTLSSK